MLAETFMKQIEIHTKQHFSSLPPNYQIKKNPKDKVIGNDWVGMILLGINLKTLNFYSESLPSCLTGSLGMYMYTLYSESLPSCLTGSLGMYMYTLYSESLHSRLTGSLGMYMYTLDDSYSGEVSR